MGGAWRKDAHQQDASGISDGGEPPGRPRPAAVRPVTEMASCDFEQVPRLEAFLAGHPEVIFEGGGFGTWQARIPHPAGETVTVRYRLGELLDRLDRLVRPDG